jgi:hypothetical protein
MTNLVTAAEIKKLTTVGENASTKKLTRAVPLAEIKHLRPLVGPRLLAELLALASTAPEAPALAGLSAQQEAAALETYEATLKEWRGANAGVLLTLWDQVKHCLAQWAVVIAWPSLLVHVDEAGVTVKTGNAQGTTSADARTLDKVWDDHRDTAIFLGDELVCWLESKKLDYAAFVSTKPLPTGRLPIDDFGGISL